MRRLARALDRDPMILYRHAPNKAALLDGVAEVVLSQLEGGPRQHRLAGPAPRRRPRLPRAGVAHPHVVPLLVTRPLPHRSPAPPGHLAPARRHPRPVTRAGFSGPDALHIYRALFGFLHGHVLNELQELVDNPVRDRRPAAAGPAPAADRRIPPARSLASVLAAYGRVAESNAPSTSS